MSSHRLGNEIRLNEDADDDIWYDIDEYDDKCDVFGVCVKLKRRQSKKVWEIEH